MRCLAKDPKKRLRDIADVRIEIDAIDEVLPGAIVTAVPLARSPNSRTTWLSWIALAAAIAVAVGSWAVRPAATTEENPLGDVLAGATFSHVTNWAGTEEHAEISPDGRFVAFLADRAGELDVWVSQLGTGDFQNLTLDLPAMMTPGNLLRSLGFNGDGSQIWFNPSGNPGREKVLMPLNGGTRRPFLPPATLLHPGRQTTPASSTSAPVRRAIRCRLRTASEPIPIPSFRVVKATKRSRFSG